MSTQDWRREWRAAAAMAAVFLLCYHLPAEAWQLSGRLGGALTETLFLLREYAREHVLTCLVPAFFIAGAVGVFIRKESVMRYLGAGAGKVVAYSVAALSGTILAVCSCTILPLFAGIYRMGAGLGPATAFLYAGPAINILAIVLTARILGPEMGLARAVGAIGFSVLIGLAMQLIFRREEQARSAAQPVLPAGDAGRSLGWTGLFFLAMIGILVFANWGAPEHAEGFWQTVYEVKWLITAGCAAGLGLMLAPGLRLPWWKVGALAALTILLVPLTPSPLIPFTAGLLGLALLLATGKGEAGDWFDQTWFFCKQILPLLLIGVAVAGLLLGRPGQEGILPSSWIADSLGGNSLAATFCASLAGAFMYFATLTEVPILKGLMGAGMGKGPALALLLAGPALSLPNMLVIRSVMGTRKTLTFIGLVVLMATIAGFLYGQLF